MARGSALKGRLRLPFRSPLEIALIVVAALAIALPCIYRRPEVRAAQAPQVAAPARPAAAESRPGSSGAPAPSTVAASPKAGAEKKDPKCPGLPNKFERARFKPPTGGERLAPTYLVIRPEGDTSHTATVPSSTTSTGRPTEDADLDQPSSARPAGEPTPPPAAENGDRPE